MSWLANYLQYWVLFVALVIFSYLTGKVILFGLRRFVNVSSWNGFEDLFAALLTGSLAILTLFSIFITRGKTTNVLFLLIGIAFVSLLGREERGKVNVFAFFPKLKLADGLQFLLYCWIIYTLFALGVIKNSDWSRFLLVRQMEDWGFYSTNLQTMMLTGQENVYHVYNLLEPDYWGMTPYHYTEMWIGGFLKFLIPQSLPIYLIGVVTYPFFVVLALVGTWAVLECWIHPSRWFHRAMTFLCFYGTGWFFLNLIHQEGLLELLTSNLTINYLLLKPRRAFSFACFLCSLLLWVKQRERLALVALLALPIVSFDSLPIVVGSLLLYAFLHLRMRPHGAAILVPVGLTYLVFLLFCFWLFQEFGNHRLEVFSARGILKQEFTFSENALLVPPLFFFRGLLQIGLQYSIHFLILYYFLRYNHKQHFRYALLLSTLMMLCALATWSAFYAFVDAIQLMTGFLSIYQTLLLILGVILLTRIQGAAKMLIAMYIVVGALSNFKVFSLPSSGGKIFPHYSQTYLNTIGGHFPKSRIGISIQSREQFEKWYLRNVMHFSLGDEYLPFMPQYLKTIELGVFEIPETPFRSRPTTIPGLNLSLDFSPIDAYRSRAWKETSIFYRYMERMRKQRPTISVEDGQIAFIDQYGIDWALASRNTILSPQLQQRVVRETRDPVSGERFLLLRTANKDPAPEDSSHNR